MNYLFTSQRLGFRFWQKTDIDAMHDMNANAEVMRYFESTRTRNQSIAILDRLILEGPSDGFCFFAVEELSTREMIGFIGLQQISFDVAFAPAIEIGWRLRRQFWNKGYATEGAKRCLEYGFEDLGFEEIVSYTTYQNKPSEKVMLKIGMEKKGTFQHPHISAASGLNPMILYKLDKSTWKQHQSVSSKTIA